MDRKQLKRWREGSFGKGAEGIHRAARWYGVSERAWRYYEAGERPIPKPLENRIVHKGAH